MGGISTKNMRPYKLASSQEGAFAFKSEADLMQTFYPLKFKEHDLHGQMIREEIDAKGIEKAAMSVVKSLRRHLSKMSAQIVGRDEEGAVSDVASSTKKGTPPQKEVQVSPVAKLNKMLIKQKEERKMIEKDSEHDVIVYPLNKVRYKDDFKFPFELLCDVPRTLRKSIEAMKMKKVQVTQQSEHAGEFDREKTLGNTLMTNFYNSVSDFNALFSVTQKDTKKKSNELIKFLECNESGCHNMIVYLFWLVITSWYHEHHQI